MKKIGILTIYDNNNYGNRLQCFALQKFIEKQGYNVYQLNMNKTDLKKKIKSCIKFILNYKNERIKLKRKKLFNKFTIDNIKYYKKTRIDEKEFDNFFVGSDQVWNPYFNTTNENSFLTFADNKKRNSYAASFGINEIPGRFKEEYFEYLSKFNNISVREDTAVKIIKELTGKNNIEVLVDPTMLLSKNDWESKMLEPNEIPQKKYILNYFLGELSKERKDAIAKFAEENNFEIINILDEKSKFFITGPSEFLYLEANAELICTDSFHSTVFALIFERPFLIFDREDEKANMNSRLETLLNKFNIDNRKFNGEINNSCLKVNYSIIDKLDYEIKKAKDFINRVIEEN